MVRRLPRPLRPYLNAKEAENCILVRAVDHTLAFHHIQGTLAVLVNVDLHVAAQASETGFSSRLSLLHGFGSVRSVSQCIHANHSA